MNIIDIIDKKRLKKELSKEEIEYAVSSFVQKSISDAQMSSLLMAICINGMSFEETSNLTDVMIKSGDVVDLSPIPGIKVDKHSTGGVGDKTTLILAPLVASCGVNVAKMSGRSLGFSGGTIDKLESIPGFNTSLTEEEFISYCKKIGVVLSGQTANLAPADKKIYALRDVTGTVESIPLIASSIMSKKIASGADKIVIDLKVGNGAFMKTLDDAKKLAKTMVEIGKMHQKETICVITNMDQVLGSAVGNSLEVLEAIQVLKGKGPKDVTNLVITLATEMVSLGKNISEEEAYELVLQKLKDQSAYYKFEEFIANQGGNLSKLDFSRNSFKVVSEIDGYVAIVKTEKIGKLINALGGGRINKDDVINHGVGMMVKKHVGDKVLKGDVLATVYYDDKNISPASVMDCFEIVNHEVSSPQVIKGILR